ncbi:serine hydrolase domain-containing protein [Nonomuraea sp. NPDC049480]|uniref:serine hydrolase domain-containing protein n=1 Tax=Nonomuraea sp. NPDC049480 TaxID=3364353 RepID=UPI003791393A
MPTLMTLRTLVTAVTLAGTTAMAAAPASAVTRSAVQTVLDETVAAGIPGMVAEVRDRGRRTFAAAGAADTTTGRPRTPHERFRVGSITKAFTATLVLQLAAERKLSLNDTVEQWLPGLVKGNGNDGSKITIRQLLNQTSGLYNMYLDEKMLYKYSGPGFLEHRFDKVNPEELIAVAMAYPPYFEPGTAFRYSNANYDLAGMIVEKATGKPYADQLARRIARPLGLSGTYLPGNETRIRGPHPRHYSRLWSADPDAKTYDVTEQNASYAWAAGGVVSTTGDLSRFLAALHDGTLLPPAQQKEIWNTSVSTEGAGWIPGTRYGMGTWQQQLSCGETVWGMGGAINGSYTYAMSSRDGKHTVVTNMNGDWNNPIAALTKAVEAEFCPPPSR